jgi:DNA polymerase-3 subunit epsilon
LAINSLKEKKNNYIIKGRGRTTEEQTIVLVKNNLYAGYGFVPKEAQIITYKNLDPFLKLQKNTLERQRIVASYVLKYPKSMMEIEKEVWSMDYT